MKSKSRRRIKFSNLILILCIAICLIFAIDTIIRIFNHSKVNNIVADGNFSSNSSSAQTTIITTTATEKPSNNNENEGKTKETTTTENPDYEIIDISNDEIHNGPLILVSATCPYSGTPNLIDFTSISDEAVIPRLPELKFQREIKDSLINLFDAYATDNGYSNLQIHSTNETNNSEYSLYTNVLTERSTGYTFDIGLITSTGDVVPYITKRNEWMVSYCWNYGFILRYSDMKTDITGVNYMPHHFRYVGVPHSLIMNEQDLCLEEYLDFVKSYTIDKEPLTYQTANKNYEIYYIPADTTSSSTKIKIPKKDLYTISGNNTDGFILTIQKS